MNPNGNLGINIKKQLHKGEAQHEKRHGDMGFDCGFDDVLVSF